MKLEHHTAFSILISGALYMVFKSWGLAAACLLSGIFIDLDHIIDYLREYGPPFKIKKFFRIFNEGRLQKAVLILHGWEWVFLLCMFSWMTDWNPFIIGLTLGFAQHLLLDEISNGTNPWGYFLLWRWKNDFVYETVFPGLKDRKQNTGYFKKSRNPFAK